MAEQAERPRKRITFEVSAEPGSTVSVAGTFNDWDPKKHVLKDKDNKGVYRINLLLHRGHHEYKFVIDGVWSVDPECETWTPNNQGSLNSVLVV